MNMEQNYRANTMSTATREYDLKNYSIPQIFLAYHRIKICLAVTLSSEQHCFSLWGTAF